MLIFLAILALALFICGIIHAAEIDSFKWIVFWWIYLLSIVHFLFE